MINDRRIISKENIEDESYFKKIKKQHPELKLRIIYLSILLSDCELLLNYGSR